MQYRKRTIIGRRRALFIATLLFLALLVLGGYKLQRTLRLVRAIKSDMDGLQSALDGNGDPGLRGMGQRLATLSDGVAALRREVDFFLPLTRHLGWVPRFGGDLIAAPALLETATAVAQAGSIAFDGLEPLIDLLENGSAAVSPLAEGLALLDAAQPDLAAARSLLADARQRRSDIKADALSGPTAELVAKLDRYLPLMEMGLAGAQMMPDLLGASGHRVYMILAQNNEELRATGGFISAVGLVEVQDGEILEISFEDSYAVDDFSHPYPDSPGPVLHYMGIDQWVFRDANWSPDFPKSARKAIELYRVSRDLEVDGVLAVDQYALQGMVEALEPLQVADWPETVTGKNVISLVRLAWSPSDASESQGFDPGWWRQRKNFISDLFNALRTKLEREPGQVDWLRLAQSLLGILDERHVQIWLADPSSAAAELLTERGWDGGISSVPNDYLMVVDSNMGFNKANAVVRENLDYRVLVFADGTAQATLTVHHANDSMAQGECDQRPRYGADYDDLINRCYWDYLRVYAPGGSHLYAATSQATPAEWLLTGERQPGTPEILSEENGKAIFGSFFVLGRGQQSEKRFVYQLPSTVLEPTKAGWRYRLFVQKQAGTDKVPLTVTVALPPGAEVLAIGPSPNDGNGTGVDEPEPGVIRFATRLEKDRSFEIQYRLDVK